MAIIISKQGKNAQVISESRFEYEDSLQEYIHKNPESIPIYELQEDKRLFIAKREFPTNSGPIDALGIDADGDIYVIETKLWKNPDKRTVLAQALDYGAALWKHYTDFASFINILDRESMDVHRISFTDKISQFFDLDEEGAKSVLDYMRHNIQDGIIKFVILMDNIDDRLKDLILYVNQNSQFDIYGVEYQFYKHDDFEILIPKIFGVEVKKSLSKPVSNRACNFESEEAFLSQCNREALGFFEYVLNTAKERNYSLYLGTKSFSVRKFQAPYFRQFCYCGVDGKFGFYDKYWDLNEEKTKDIRSILMSSGIFKKSGERSLYAIADKSSEAALKGLFNQIIEWVEDVAKSIDTTPKEPVN